MAGRKFYITTTLPYVNAAPHMGHALEFIQADVIARYHRYILGEDVFFNIGTDEHGLKIFRKAEEGGKDPQKYVDEYAIKFKDFCRALNVDYTDFIRTTDPHHIGAAQEFWKRCKERGYIEKKLYKTKYCVGCELEKTDSELKNGRCVTHPNLEIEIIEEENYFFKFSGFQKQLTALYGKYQDFVLPAGRLNEIRRFVEAGLQDFSISRLKKKMPWGVPVPGDDEHVMYVWFDALVNYVSTLGWPENEGKLRDFWGTEDHPNAVQIAGKDNLRQQSAMWQAMLMAAGLPTSRQILIHGFITSKGSKMSKSLGNVSDPLEVASRYGADGLRYWLLREIPAFEDGDFSEEKMHDRYNGDLANGLGNFTSRVLTLGAGLGEIPKNLQPDSTIAEKIKRTKKMAYEKLTAYKFHESLAAIWDLIGFGDSYVNETKPWEIRGEKLKAQMIFNLIVVLDNIAALIKSFLPETAEKITACINWDGALRIRKGEVLFPRLK